jgi:hypothetical protein
MGYVICILLAIPDVALLIWGVRELTRRAR